MPSAAIANGTRGRAWAPLHEDRGSPAGRCTGIQHPVLVSHRAPVTPQCSAAVGRQARPAGSVTVCCPAGRASRLHSQLQQFAEVGTQLSSSKPWEIPARKLGRRAQHWAMEQCCRPPSPRTSAESHPMKPRDVPIQVSHLLLRTAFGLSCALPTPLWSCRSKEENKAGVNPKGNPAVSRLGKPNHVLTSLALQQR